MIRFILMSITSVVVMIALAAIHAACGSAIPDRVGEPEGRALCSETDPESCGDERTSQIAVDDQGPPDKFQPRSHPSHRRAGYIPHPDLNRLPKLILRLSDCYPALQDREAKIARPYAQPMGPQLSTRRKRSVKGGGTPGKKKEASRRLSSADLGRGGVGLQSAAPKMAAKSSGMAEAEVQESRSTPPAEIAVQEEGASSSDRIAPEYEQWGAKIYLSNDDTMSLSSAQRVIYAIDKFLPLPLEHIRPHELLNYFSFQTEQDSPERDFSVKADIESDPREEGAYTLALAVRGRSVDKASRRNVALTLVIDRSGSMQAEGRMSYLKRGLRRMVNELKDGDMLHMVLFDHNICSPVENFVVGRDDRSSLNKAIDALTPQGSTDLHSGLSRGYEIADRSYRPGYSNRVVMITDALTNTGVTDEQMISMISKYYETRQIRLSGIGVGRDFNDALLDRLTERGKGAYLFLGSEAEVDAVFGSRFISLIETTALDVHFRLHLPKSLRMKVFYGEESSTVKEDVQAIHYFANTSQLFLSDVVARGYHLRTADDIMLTIEYREPESGDRSFEEYAFNLGQIQGESFNVRKGRLIMTWIDMLAQMAARPLPAVHSVGAGSWEDAEGYRTCEEGRRELSVLSQGIDQNSEVKRVLSLWEKYCSRYERPRNPVRRKPVSQQPGWPSAQSEERR